MLSVQQISPGQRCTTSSSWYFQSCRRHKALIYFGLCWMILKLLCNIVVDFIMSAACMLVHFPTCTNSQRLNTFIKPLETACCGRSLRLRVKMPVHSWWLLILCVMSNELHLLWASLRVVSCLKCGVVLNLRLEKLKFFQRWEGSWVKGKKHSLRRGWVRHDFISWEYSTYCSLNRWELLDLSHTLTPWNFFLWDCLYIPSLS